MRRWMLILLMIVSPGWLLLGSSGCGERKVHIERRSERIEESPPRTVSPGEPIVE